MRISICDDDDTVRTIYTVSVELIAAEVRKLNLRGVGDVRAAWNMLTTATEAVEPLQDEILSAVAAALRK